MAHAPTATRPHAAFGRVTTNNGAVCAWAARGTKKRGLRVVCALSGARLLRLRCQGNQGKQETTEITEINRNRQKSTDAFVFLVFLVLPHGALGFRYCACAHAEVRVRVPGWWLVCVRSFIFQVFGCELAVAIHA